MTLEELKINNIENKKEYLISDSEYQALGNLIYLYYTVSKTLGGNNHFFKCQIPEMCEKIACYSYFKMSQSAKTSSFIGMKVEKEFRGSNLGMFLFAMWVKTILDYDEYNLKLQKRQVKPGIIYIAKKFGFEIKDANARYAKSPQTIFICQKEGEKEKHLLFQDRAYQQQFQSASVSQQGNNKYIDPKKDDFTILDRVILNHTYQLDPHYNDYAYCKAEKVLNSFKI